VYCLATRIGIPCPVADSANCRSERTTRCQPITAPGRGAVESRFHKVVQTVRNLDEANRKKEQLAAATATVAIIYGAVAWMPYYLGLGLAALVLLFVLKRMERNRSQPPERRQPPTE
jgi:hypothetical protein